MSQNLVFMSHYMVNKVVDSMAIPEIGLTQAACCKSNDMSSSIANWCCRVTEKNWPAWHVQALHDGLYSSYGDYRVGFRFVSDPDGGSIGAMIDDIGWRVGTMTGIEDSGPELPVRLTLHQNYPNPFNPQTAIAFGLPEKSTVALDIFDLLGRKIKTIEEGYFNVGNYAVHYDRSDLASGVYFVRLKAGYGQVVKKVVVVR